MYVFDVFFVLPFSVVVVVVVCVVFSVLSDLVFHSGLYLGVCDVYSCVWSVFK